MKEEAASQEVSLFLYLFALFLPYARENIGIIAGDYSYKRKRL